MKAVLIFVVILGIIFVFMAVVSFVLQIVWPALFDKKDNDD
jgi:hypothetical protein